MSETLTCGVCDHIADRRDLVVIHPLSPLRCKDAGACNRRQKRDKVLAEMQEMVRKPHLHTVDKFTRTSVALCGFFLGCVLAMCTAYLLFGV